MKRMLGILLTMIMLCSVFPVTKKAHALTQREKIAQIALGEVGVSGRPNKYTKWYGDYYGSWCAVFISWCAYKAGISGDVIKKNASAYVNDFDVPYYRYSPSAGIRMGDILYVENNASFHVGLVYDVDESYIYTVEGNMSDSVKLCQYVRSSGYTTWSGSYEWQKILYYGVPEYPDDIAGEAVAKTYCYGNKYVLYERKVTYEKAEKLCRMLGGQMLTVSSAKVNSAIYELIKPYGSCWAGASDADSEGTWKNTDGEKIKYKNWLSGQPDNVSGKQDYALMRSSDGKWTDESGSAKALFVCEFPNRVKLDSKLYISETNHTYEYYPEELTWAEAKAYCAYKGGHLFTLASPEEAKQLADYLKKTKKTVWAGAHINASSGKWKWVTGEPFDYQQWDEAKLAANKKAGVCLEILSGGGWNESSDETRRGFICEYDHTHLYGEPIVKKASTTKASGKIVYQCGCGDSYEKTVPQIASVKLSSSASVYSGAEKKPTVTVKRTDGKKLKEGTDYTVSYPSSIKNIGSYTVKVTLKRLYSGTVKLGFTVNPPSTSFTSLKPGKGYATLKWKAVSSVSGYEVYYYSSSAKKYVKDGATSAASYTFSDLVSKKTYMVKVRSYKTVKGVKYYSAFSSVRKVKAK